MIGILNCCEVTNWSVLSIQCRHIGPTQEQQRTQSAGVCPETEKGVDASSPSQHSLPVVGVIYQSAGPINFVIAARWNIHQRGRADLKSYGGMKRPPQKPMYRRMMSIGEYYPNFGRSEFEHLMVVAN